MDCGGCSRLSTWRWNRLSGAVTVGPRVQGVGDDGGGALGGCSRVEDCTGRPLLTAEWPLTGALLSLSPSQWR